MDIRNQTANPCVGLCELGATGLCLGCGRSREERHMWYQLPEIKQREILERLAREPLLSQGGELLTLNPNDR